MTTQRPRRAGLSTASDPLADIRAFVMTDASADVRALLDQHTGLQPSPRPTSVEAQDGAVESWNPPVAWSLSDGLNDHLSPSFLTDLIANGLPNGTFSVSDSDTAISEFWTASNGGGAKLGTLVLIADATKPGGWKWRYSNVNTRTGAVDDSTLTSALVPYIEGDDLFVVADAILDSTKVQLQATVSFYNENQTLLGTQTKLLNPSALTGSRRWRAGPFTRSAGDAAALCSVALTFQSVAGSASNWDLWRVSLRDFPPAIFDDQFQVASGAGLSISPFLLRAVNPDVSSTIPVINLYQSSTGVYEYLYRGFIELSDNPVVNTVGLQWASGDRLVLGAVEIQSSGTFTALAQVRANAVSSPTPGVAANDWAPAGSTTAAVFRIAPTAAINVSGIAGGADGRLLFLLNIDTTFAFTLLHQSALSVAANRFILPAAASVIINPGHGCVIWWDAVPSRWRMVSRT